MKRLDLTNQRFGNLTVLEPTLPSISPSGKKNTVWKCQCDCGNITNVFTYNLRTGHTTSCGCACGRIDITGRKYGRLTALQYVGEGYWECKCDCGNKAIVKTYNLNSGNTQSCGCLQKDRASEVSLVSLVGNRYGKLTVISRVENNRFGHVCYHCICDCGGETIVDATNLRNGNTISCGCIKSKGEMVINNWLVKHGFNFRSQYSFDDCFLSSGRRPFFDFVIFNNNIPCLIIEYNGRQHYEVTGGWNTKEQLEHTQRRDREKMQWCKDNHYPVLVIKYNEDIECALKKLLNIKQCADIMEI